MSQLLSRIRAHSGPDRRRKILVPEWGDGDEPLVIHYSMVTMADLAAAREGAEKSADRQNVNIICIKAEDEAGKPMFRRIDAVELMATAAPEVVLRIANEMLNRADAGDIEKN